VGKKGAKKKGAARTNLFLGGKSASRKGNKTGPRLKLDNKKTKRRRRKRKKLYGKRKGKVGGKGPASKGGAKGPRSKGGWKYEPKMSAGKRKTLASSKGKP